MACDGFTDKANAYAVARMLGIKRRRDARTLTKRYLFFMVFYGSMSFYKNRINEVIL